MPVCQGGVAKKGALPRGRSRDSLVTSSLCLQSQGHTAPIKNSVVIAAHFPIMGSQASFSNRNTDCFSHHCLAKSSDYGKSAAGGIVSWHFSLQSQLVPVADPACPSCPPYPILSSLHSALMPILLLNDFFSYMASPWRFPRAHGRCMVDWG